METSVSAKMSEYLELSLPETNVVSSDILNSGTTSPLFNELILEKVLQYCKWNQNEKTFQSRRLVCKYWDSEVSRILRKTTQIPISRLLAPYPDGLGWTWDPQNDDSSYFDCPYPQTRTFENIKIDGTCHKVNDLQLIRFLAIQGYQIKSLDLISTLYCGHQTKFVWDVLHSWCPNLETLHLSGIQSFSCLINTFKWEQSFNRTSHWEFTCEKLNTLILSIEDITPTCKYIECDREIDIELSNQLLNYIESLKVIHKDIKRTSTPIHSIEEFAQLSQFIQGENEYLPNLQKDNSKKFKKYMPKHFLDFGVLGHILTEAPLKKLIIKKLEDVAHCEDLLLLILHHPSNRRKYLRHLEFHENVHLGNNSLFAELLCFLQSPLRTLHLNNLLPFKNSLSDICGFLTSCAESLEHLEFGIHLRSFEEKLFERTKVLKIPLLPKLKTILIKRNRCFLVHSKILLKNAPSLVKLSIVKHQNWPGYLRHKDRDLFCRFLKKGHSNFENSSKLRELTLSGYLCIRNFKNVCNQQFCGLVKVEFSVDGSCMLENLLKGMRTEWQMLESVRLSIGSLQFFKDKADILRLNYIVGEHIGGLHGLRFLDITLEYYVGTFLSVDTFKKGFNKLRSLTSLKLTNVQLLRQDKQEIECSVSHIPYVSFSEVEYVSNAPTPDKCPNETRN